MIHKLLYCFFVLFLGVSSAWSQSNKLIKELESKQGALQKQISAQESLLHKTTKNVSSQLNALSTLSGQIEERKRFILSLTKDMNKIERELAAVNRQIAELQKELKNKKDKYAASLQYIQQNRSIEEKLMFIFSADNLSQIYRRLRYVQEYASYQKELGEELIEQEKKIGKKKAELQEVKKAKTALLKKRQNEQKKLQMQEEAKRKVVNGLQKRKREIQAELKKKRQQSQRLNAQIDRLIAEEIERARREAKREAANRHKKDSDKKTSTSNSHKKASPMGAYTMSKADVKLSSNFSANRGKLPMPISGPYIITSHYGEYAVAGLRNIKLDNKGIDIQGKPGAKARAIFNGKVTAVFQLNGLFNVLIRHGSYISVYCNLSMSNVKQGDIVKTKQVIGEVFSNLADEGRTILHFQLRKEKAKLNPEVWLNR